VIFEKKMKKFPTLETSEIIHDICFDKPVKMRIRSLLLAIIMIQPFLTRAQLFPLEQSEISRNRISVITELQICPAGKKDSLRTEYSYDQDGLIRKKKYGNTVETYKYNENRQLEDIEVSPLFYNPHHNIIQWEKPDKSEEITYDISGNVLKSKRKWRDKRKEIWTYEYGWWLRLPDDTCRFFRESDEWPEIKEMLTKLISEVRIESEGKMIGKIIYWYD
jgi:hypothetical protein